MSDWIGIGPGFNPQLEVDLTILMILFLLYQCEPLMPILPTLFICNYEKNSNEFDE